MRKDFMIDIECLTLGTHPVITEVGISVFDEKGTISDTLKVYFNIEDGLKNGFKISNDTFAFWLSQPDENRLNLANNIETRSNAYPLTAMMEFIKEHDNGESYFYSYTRLDEEAIKAYFEEYNLPYPIDTRRSKCYRTITMDYKEIRDRNKAKFENLHDSLVDNEHQIMSLIEIQNLPKDYVWVDSGDEVPKYNTKVFCQLFNGEKAIGEYLAVGTWRLDQHSSYSVDKWLKEVAI